MRVKIENKYRNRVSGLNWRIAYGLLAAAIVFAVASTAQAQVLLDITIGSGSITMTATGVDPIASDSNSVNLYLDDFFPEIPSGPNAGYADGAGTLQDSQGVSPNFFSYGHSDPIANQLDLQSQGALGTQVFTFDTTDPAFQGSSVFIFEAGSDLGFLPEAGASGTMETDDGVTIGSWEVVAVPEPSTWVLIGVGLAVVLYRPKKRMA